MWDAPLILAGVILTLFALERIVVYQLMARFFPQLKQTTTILRASSTVMSSLHSSASFSSAFYMLLTSELYPAGGVVFVDYYLLPQYRLHMLCEFGWYLFDTMSEIAQMVFPPKEENESLPDAAVAPKQPKKEEKPTSNSWVLQAGFLIHHMPPLFGLYVYHFHGPQLPVATQRICAFIIIRMTMWHVTTPLQNLRWFMDKLQLGEGFLSTTQSTSTRFGLLVKLVYQLNFALFLVGFFGVRIYGMLPLLRSVAGLYGMPPETTVYQIVKTLMPVKCLFLTGILYVLSVYWFHLNARRALRVFFPKRRESEQKRVVAF